MRRPRVCDITIQVLKDTGNEAVMYGDEGLMHLIAMELHWKIPSDIPGWDKLYQRLLNALTKTPGDLIHKFTQNGRGRLVRIFRLPEEDSA